MTDEQIEKICEAVKHAGDNAGIGFIIGCVFLGILICFASSC